MGNFMDTQNFVISQKSLDALWLKQKVISNNLANIDTPGYKSSSVEFEDILRNTLALSSSQNGLLQKLSALQPKIIQDTSTQMRQDGNNVDVDEQNIELTRAQIQYEYMSRVLSEDISRMKYAINGGRG